MAGSNPSRHTQRLANTMEPMMTTSPASQIAPLIVAVESFLAVLDAMADQHPTNAPDMLGARAILDRDLQDLRSAHAEGDEQTVALSLLAIVNADAGMADSGIDLTRPPLQAAWGTVQEAAAPVLDALAG